MSTSPLFNDPHADVVLRSSDGIDFHIDLAVLTMASPVFEDMTTLPSPSSQDNKEGRPIISLQDTSTTLELLLQIIHPTMHPSFKRVADVRVYSALLEAADKYQMPKVLPAVENTLIGSRYLTTEGDALRVFAVATRYGMDSPARAAARALLAFPPLYARAEIPELEGVSATAYHRLLNYRKRCVEILFGETQTAYDRQWVGRWADIVQSSWGGSYPFWCCPHCRRIAPTPQWFCDHVERIKKAYSRKVTAETVASTELLEMTIKSVTPSGIQHCTCHERAAADLMRLSTILTQKVERELAKIEY